MNENLGITKGGIEAAYKIKESYRAGEPICVPGDPARILLPEHLINSDLDLIQFEDPLPLALMAVRDPESPMALAATMRLSPKAGVKALIAGVYEVVGEKTRHPLVKRCIDVVKENDFNPQAIAFVQTRTARFIVETRNQYAAALKVILRALLNGDMSSSDFVRQFIDLTQMGNLRNDVRQKLVTSLLLSKTVRPGIKFLMLDHFDSFPIPTRQGIIQAVAQAPHGRHIEALKEELRWIVSPARQKKLSERQALAQKQALAQNGHPIVH